MTARVVPSAAKALSDMDADRTTPDSRKQQIMKDMIDRNAKTSGISMLPYVSSLTVNSATKVHDNLDTTYQKQEEEQGFSLGRTAFKTGKKALGALASVPQALLYPVVKGAQAADYLAQKAAQPFTGKEYQPLLPADQLEQVRKESWQAAPMASTVLLGAAGAAAGVPLTALSGRAAITSAGLAGLGTLETGGTVGNAAMNALVSGVSTKAFLSLGPVGSAATAVAATGVNRLQQGEDLNSGSAAEDYLSSAALGYIGGKAIQKEKAMLTRGPAGEKLYQPQKPVHEMPSTGERLQTVAQSMYQSALKPSKAVLDRYPDVIKTGLEEGIPVSKAGGERVLDTIDTINSQIGSQIAKSKKEGKVVFSSNVVNALADTVKFYKEVIGGKKQVTELQELANEFVMDEGVAIPVDRAQKLKVNTYRVLRKAYGEMKAAEIEGKKSLARGLKEEIVAAIPELGELNARESKLIGLDAALERFTGRYGNRELIDLTSGIGGAVGMVSDGLTGGLKGFALTKLAKLAIDHPTIKSQIAIYLNKLGKQLSPPKVLAPEEVPPTMEIINLNTQPPKLQNFPPPASVNGESRLIQMKGGKQGTPGIDYPAPVSPQPQAQKSVNGGSVGAVKNAIPKELEPLAAEARKYKSVEEFVKKAQEVSGLSNYDVARNFGKEYLGLKNALTDSKGAINKESQLTDLWNKVHNTKQ